MFLNMSYIDPTHRDPATRKFKSGSESRANPYSRIKCAALRVPVCKHAYVPLFNIPPFLHSYLFEHPPAYRGLFVWKQVLNLNNTRAYHLYILLFQMENLLLELDLGKFIPIFKENKVS